MEEDRSDKNRELFAYLKGSYGLECKLTGAPPWLSLYTKITTSPTDPHRDYVVSSVAGVFSTASRSWRIPPQLVVRCLVAWVKYNPSTCLSVIHAAVCACSNDIDDNLGEGTLTALLEIACMDLGQEQNNYEYALHDALCDYRGYIQGILLRGRATQTGKGLLSTAVKNFTKDLWTKGKAETRGRRLGKLLVAWSDVCGSSNIAGSVLEEAVRQITTRLLVGLSPKQVALLFVPRLLE